MNQDDWTSWLPMAEFSYNNTPLASTKFTPFLALYGYHPRFNTLVASSGVPAADKFVEHLQNIQEQLVENLVMAKLTQAKFYDKGRRIDTYYNPGDLVWLSRKHIKTRRNNSKLDVRRIGPFRVRRMVGKNAAELVLPANLSRLHPVFNVSLLMPFVSEEEIGQESDHGVQNAFTQKFVEWASIAYVLDYRTQAEGIHEYLIRDDDPSGLNDEWKSLTELSTNLDQFLRQFHHNTPSRGSGPSDAIWEYRRKMQV